MTLHATAWGRRILVPILFTILGISFASRAQAQVDPLWDHYKVYQTLAHPSHIEQVTLIDQFQTRTDDVVQYLDRLANPVAKNHGAAFYPINRPELHYTWWALSQRPPIDINVLAINQFGDQYIHVGGPYTGWDTYLLNPANKNAPTGTPLPLANHYKCYPAQGAPVNTTVGLSDQFFSRNAVVFEPRWFCAPCEKRLLNGTVYPMVDPKQHYTVYEIDYTNTFWPARISDQFITDFQTDVAFDRFLMVPTQKELPTPSDPTTWGRVKGLYR